MLNLAGYQEINQIYTGQRTMVYRAIQETSRQPAIVKVLRNPHPSFNELVQFRNQYTIASHLEHPAIIKCLSLEPYTNGYALVMADSGAIALSDYWPTQNHSLNEFLHIAIQLAEALQYLAQQRIIHKDIKPANILIHPETHLVKLIDFSISTLLPKEQQQLINPNILEGTLAYISPEQTGRMNRGIDYRTDFYSLGVTFFELLTGKLPFDTRDPMELVHCHLAKMPTVLENGEEIPQVLSDIVMKLMAKNAEERYQSAFGLKYDLEQCLQQLETIGKMISFELGERDVCDRFLIPEKLYGRESEVKVLLDGFERVANPPLSKRGVQSPPTPLSKGGVEMILVAGFSGIGKTAVVNEVHKPIVKQRGYFIKGKFDQFNRNIPFSAFVQAFRNLMGQLLGESDAKLANWKAKILKALGENGQIIIEVIPELERIIDQQPPVAPLSGSAAQNRFNLLFGKFVRVFTTKEHPLVIFLDDLQWADSASLNLLKLLMDESETGYLLVLGAYRDNEVFPAHPLILTLDEIKKRGANINTITLAPLEKLDITRLVADTLLCSVDVALPLSELVYDKTKGNPFFTTQFLKGLYEDNCITFEADAGYWQCDLAQTRQLALTDDVVAFMIERLRKLPSATQAVLKLAACIGNQFDLGTLAVVCEGTQERVAKDLWRGLQEGFVIPESQTYKFFQGMQNEENEVETISVSYRFLHDRVQQAAYSLISEEKKQATHLKIGRQLWHNIPDSEQENYLFTIVNHLNIGCDLILEPLERDKIAQLNWQASQKAKVSVAYETSRRYCYAGQLFLHEQSWETNYSLCFALAIATIEAEYFNHNLQVAQQLCQETLEKARSLLDRIKIYELQIIFKINQNQMNEAIFLAFDALVFLDICLPTEPQQIQTEIELLRQEIALPTEEIANLVTLEIVNNEEKLAVIRLLINANSAAYIANPTFYPLIVLHTVRHCMKYGHSPLAASAYSWYGALLCGFYGEIEAGYEFGKLSLQLLEKFNARTIAAKVSNMFNVFIRPWKEPLKNAVAALPEAIQSGFDNGDVEYAFYGIVHYCNYLFYSGNPLEQVLQAQERYLPRIIKAKYEFHEGFLRINQQVVVNLLRETDEPQYLQGLVLNGKKCLSQWLENNIVFLVLCFYEAQTRLAYLFEDYIEAIQAGEKGWQYRQAAMGTLYVSEHNFYYSLALLTNGKLKLHESERVAENQTQLKSWAEFAPTNFQHKYDLVEAERYRVLEDKLQALELYDCGITGAKENKYLQEEALGNELAAKFYLDWGKEKIAATYMQEAYYCYARWGAKAKTDQLEQKYPQLLAPIIQNTQSPLNFNHTLNSTKSLDTVSSSSSHYLLDIASVIKVSQAISQEIEFNALISTLMNIVLENAGADKGTLILNNTGTWEIITQCEKNSCHLSPMPLDDANSLPLSIINTVKHTKKILLINDISQNTSFSGDTYLIQQQPKSLICTPIINQGKLIGLIYLENNFTVEAFTPNHIEILKLLSAQAAISIENAQLYNTLEQKVQQRTAELSKALEDLKATQKQLVESEKMAALGGLVAGVAHEINTPIGTSITIASTLADETQNFTKALAQGQLKRSVLNNYLELAGESTQLMLSNLSRAGELIQSFKQIAADQSNLEYRCFNLKEYLKEIALSLAPQMKTSYTLTVEGDETIKIDSYPGALAQIVTNLVTNSLTHGYPSEEAGNFTLGIRQESDKIQLEYSDDGCGIEEENLGKIFEPFFTTARSKGGTGLGLHIVYNLVTQKLQGTIEVDSQVGLGTKFVITIPLTQESGRGVGEWGSGGAGEMEY
ncbi:MAG: AAA family ATPase [Okeania sp. SIO3B5]|uniref:trifunctional serine/threonine-protein kinase/ATP-binding protein/sensor histidine kinase n=1 Tax=Okeania sp. SIO3B5 TaxID=2607811 RepID=UPI0014018E1A|nr:ATP-binding sensor histidine kinase [Okeania sp. SIO3B5]NEO56647.1 AAA family ATPase [Okeania sp. SIO3B5]